MLDKTIIPQQAAAGQQPQETDNQILHPKSCLCNRCLFLPKVKDAEALLFWTENRLAKSGARWQQHWQQQVFFAQKSLNFWQRQLGGEL